MKNDDVTGRRVDLTDGRVVFVGQSKRNPGWVYIGFKNSEGDDTKFLLSAEAAECFGKLLTDKKYGKVCGDFPHKTVWRVVREGELENAKS